MFALRAFTTPVATAVGRRGGALASIATAASRSAVLGTAAGRSTLLGGVHRCGARSLATITRLQTADPRMCGIVVHGDTVYLSGQVPADFDAPLDEQVSSTLAKVDALLAEAGTDKSKLLSAQLWLKSMDDFAEMNAVWSAWLDPDNKPVRACVEAPMAHPGILFEVMVVCAK